MTEIFKGKGAGHSSDAFFVPFRLKKEENYYEDD